jgi:hypothetical protein
MRHTETIVLYAYFPKAGKRYVTLVGPRYPKLRKRHPKMQAAIDRTYEEMIEAVGERPTVRQILLGHNVRFRS